MKEMIEAGIQVDSVVSDPPYSIGFMAKAWDNDIACKVETWKLCLELLRPGGHLVAFSSTRTYHRMACAIEDAGFEIRDQIGWLFGQGFPKSLDVGKAIDKMAGAEREVIGTYNARGFSVVSPTEDGRNQWAAGEVIDKPATRTAPATEEARQWDGWGTALKPAWEPICLARKPLIGTVAKNVLEFGTGALNIDACRVGWPDGPPKIGTPGWGGPAKKLTVVPGQEGETVERTEPNAQGRWPTNVVHDGSDEVEEEFAKYGLKASCMSPSSAKPEGRILGGARSQGNLPMDSGTASRFFTSTPVSREGEASANRRYTEEGSTNFAATPGPRGGAPEGRWPTNLVHDGSVEVEEEFAKYGIRKTTWVAESHKNNRSGEFLGQLDHPGAQGFNDTGTASRFYYCAKANKKERAGSKHPTVKPIALMRWLCRMVTPPEGIVLDPFAGTGSTGAAAILEGFFPVLIEQDAQYVEDIKKKLLGGYLPPEEGEGEG